MILKIVSMMAYNLFYYRRVLLITDKKESYRLKESLAAGQTIYFAGLSQRDNPIRINYFIKAEMRVWLVGC